MGVSTITRFIDESPDRKTFPMAHRMQWKVEYRSVGVTVWSESGHM